MASRIVGLGTNGIFRIVVRTGKGPPTGIDPVLGLVGMSGLTVSISLRESNH